MINLHVAGVAAVTKKGAEFATLYACDVSSTAVSVGYKSLRIVPLHALSCSSDVMDAGI